MKIHVPALIVVILFAVFIAILAYHERLMSQIEGCTNCQQSTAQVLQRLEQDITAPWSTAEDHAWLNKGKGLSSRAVLTVNQIREGMM